MHTAAFAGNLPRSYQVLMLSLAVGVSAIAFPSITKAQGKGGGKSAEEKNSPTAEQALAFKPLQQEVRFDSPTNEERGKCTIEKESAKGNSQKVIGFVVKDGEGRLLRRFVDTDGDNQLDTWSYYKDGIEAYREHGKPAKKDDPIDPHEFRWLGENGTRWGIDRNSNGKIDHWVTISPEEISEEFITCVKLKDAERFSALTISDKEVDKLPLSAEKKKEIKTRAAASRKDFANYAAGQKQITSKTAWISLGGVKPMTFMIDDENDVTVYENVFTIFDTDGDPATADDRPNIPLGTFIHVEIPDEVNAWRMIDLPSEEPGKVFMLGAHRTEARPNEAADPPMPAANANAAKLFKRIAELEGKPPAVANDFSTLADLYEEVLEQIEGEPYDNTVMGYAQTLEQGASATDAASGKTIYPAAVERLRKLLKKVESKQDLAAFVNYRLLTAEFYVDLAKATTPKAQSKAMSDHIDALKAHVETYPDSDESPKAYNDLAMNLENEGRTDEAKKYYEECASRFPETLNGKIASGAIRRLSVMGKPLNIKGQTLDNRSWVPTKGKPYILFYFTGAYPQLDDEIKALREAETKGAKSGLQIVGVSLEAKAADAKSTAKTLGLKWPVLFADGGMEGQHAIELGVLQTPLVIVVDKEGKVHWQGGSAREALSNLPK